MHYTHHRYDPATKMATVFNVAKCDNCHGDVVEPNAISVTLASLPKLNTTPARVPFAEVVPVGNGYACTVCEPDA